MLTDVHSHDAALPRPGCLSAFFTFLFGGGHNLHSEGCRHRVVKRDGPSQRIQVLKHPPNLVLSRGREDKRKGKKRKEKKRMRR